ncbi:hypothetical protein Tsp_02175 [Trichinella spiralis]|uniref:hypothetical protein n=1 Tax=Trichinella spiralis TaxID=6334 RepID=UPI0001EFC4B6|nr:hypothetical protein Tsp_02175 [Trichinella spiralis]
MVDRSKCWKECQQRLVIFLNEDYLGRTDVDGLRIQISYHNPEVWQCVTSEFRCVRIMFELPGLPEAQCCPSQRFNIHESELLEARHYKAASAMILVLKQQYLTSRSCIVLKRKYSFTLTTKELISLCLSKSLSPKVTVKRLTVDLEEPNGRDAVD